MAPGLAVAAGCAALAWAGHEVVGLLSPLVMGVLLGVAIANGGAPRALLAPGARLASRHVLRAGIVLLGFRLAAGDALELGAPGLALVVVVIVVTFFGTRRLGRWLGLSPGLSTLTATGFSICGASAIAAMDGVVDADEEEVTYAIGLVTLCGSLAILVLPSLAGPLGLDGQAFGAWVGASVHDVGQVVATASTKGDAAVAAAVVVKLTRVVMLAPLVTVMSVTRRRRGRGGGGARTALVPGFVVAFLAAVGVRSTGLLAPGTLDVLRLAEVTCFATALAGIGLSVDLARLRRLGRRPVALGLASWALIAVVSYGGVLMVR